MNDDQNKKLMKLFGVTWFLLLIMFIALLFSLLREPDKQTNNYTSPKADQGPQGLQGPPGERGLQGLQGIPGETAKSMVQIETHRIVEQVPVKGDPGPAGQKGEQGEPGTAGRSPELRRNEETGDIEWKLEGDRFWQVLIQSCDLKDGGCKKGE